MNRLASSFGAWIAAFWLGIAAVGVIAGSLLAMAGTMLVEGPVFHYGWVMAAVAGVSFVPAVGLLTVTAWWDAKVLQQQRLSMSRRDHGRDDEIVRWIDDYLAEHRYAPSVRELGVHLGLSSSSTVAYLINRLQSEGRIDFDPGQPRDPQDLGACLLTSENVWNLSSKARIRRGRVI